MTAFVLAGLCIVGLFFAQPITCRVLGGTWLSNNSCVNEWGGNGHNQGENLRP